MLRRIRDLIARFLGLMRMTQQGTTEGPESILRDARRSLEELRARRRDAIRRLLGRLDEKHADEVRKKLGGL